MKTLILFIAILVAACANDKPVKYVYICDSPTAYAYHSDSTCEGLRDCHHRIIKVTLEDAVNKYHRKPCHICEEQ